MKQITNIFKSSFVKNVLIIATGAAGAQLIGMLMSPIITRLYGPEAFGVMGTFSSMLTLIIPIAALTYPIAIVLPKSDEKAKSIMKLSFVITLIVSSVSFLIILVFINKLASLFNLNDVKYLLYLIPLAIFFSGTMEIIEQWLIRTKQFTVNAKVKISQSLIMNFTKTGIGFIHPTAAVLVILTALNDGSKAFMMYMFSDKKKFSKNEKEEYSKKDLAAEYKDFPLYRAPESFFSKLSQSLPVLMLTAFFGPASAGFYSIGRTVLSMPSRLIANSVGDVFYPRISEAANNKEDVTKLIQKATLALAGIGIIPFGIIVLFGPPIFSFVFGAEWETAGEYARWIALWSFSNFINKPSVKTLPVLNAQKLHLKYTIITTIVRTSVLIIGFLIFNSDIIAVLLFGISGFVLNIGLILITIYLSKESFKKSFKL